MCRLGKQQIDERTAAQNNFTLAVALHQQAQGLGVSIEQPKGSILFETKEFVKAFGTPDMPNSKWSFYRTEGCQLHVVYPGQDNPGQPMMKATNSPTVT